MISATILTKNSQKYLKEVLKALSDFDEVLVFDNGSQDQTLDIAKTFSNVRIHHGKFEGFGQTHNVASSLASNDWILSIDSDEVVTEGLVKEILGLKLNKKYVYSIPRNNEFNQTFIRWCGWYPDRQVRLYNRQTTCFSDAKVHESVITKGLTIFDLKEPLKHYSYETIFDFLAKMQSYSDLFALQNCGKKHSSPWIAVGHAFFAFFKSYILKRGIMGGYEGFLISTYNSHTAFYKYIKLYEANGKVSRSAKMRR